MRVKSKKSSIIRRNIGILITPCSSLSCRTTGTLELSISLGCNAGIRKLYTPNQGAIRKGPAADGFWAVDVEKDGRYEFKLRRWPIEVKGKGIEAVKARLKIAGADETIDIPEGASDTTFTVQLKAGKTRMQTWLTNSKGVARGAYYVYVKRL